MTAGRRRADALAIVGAVAVAACFAYGVVGRFGRGLPGYDVFAYAHPNFLYARRAWEQGYGLLWNDLANCGQPFFAIISTALLNPVNALSFVLDPAVALSLKLFVNFAIAGIGMVLLCRAIGLGSLAAFCGALAFLLGGGCAVVGRTGSFIIGPYVWLPAAAFLCERILRAPSPRTGIVLGLVLSVQLLAGFPQIVVFTYQWIALRVLFELATRRPLPFRRTAGALALGLLLPPLLAAVQFVPSLELLEQSVRNRTLTLEEMQPGLRGDDAFGTFRQRLGARSDAAGPLLPVLGVFLASLAFAAPGARRIAAFFAAATAVYFALALSASLFELYQLLPLGRLFRSPSRFLWMASFSFGPLVACGVDAVVRRRAVGRADQLTAAGAATAALAGLHLLSPTGFLGWEWALLAASGAAVVAALCFEWGRTLAAVALPLLLAWNLYALAGAPVGLPAHPMAPTVRTARVTGHEDLFATRWAFELVGRRGGGQDRMYQYGRHFDFSLIPKSASVFGVPSITDYEPQASRRYAELFVRMLTDGPMLSLNQFYFQLHPLPKNRALLDLLATRYLVADTDSEPDPATLRPRPRLLERRGSVAVYENPQALPRAFYVPRVQVIEEAESLLERLASPEHRPRRVALIEETPADGFLGEPGGRGTVEIVESRGERLEIRVRASEEGFLFVSDQHYPGWEATVDGVPVPIERANYAFRLVRVPRGDSTVAFHYRPASLRIGALVSALTSAGLLAYAGLAARRAWYRSRVALPTGTHA